ncbi:unnamed protein product [Lactuca saligna]|uniref:Uncharacterized protein n=1 Tax=Lactuca saligna TaxID=75948 RepID=A0AA35UJH9_LACSI|nr:unnamed protein product [Lactuca saligna]
MNRRLIKVEKDVAIMKLCMALCDNDDMVVYDTPPSSPGDQSTPPLPPLINRPPPPLPPSYPSSNKTSPPNSPPQSDAARKGRIIKRVATQKSQEAESCAINCQNHMYLHRIDNLPSAPTKRLFHLHMEGRCHYELERGYRVMISLELIRRPDELKLDQFRRIKLEILKQANKFYSGSSDESEEEA